MLRVKHCGLNDTSNLPQSPPFIYGVNTPFSATGSSSKNPKCVRTLTPPLGDEEAARLLSDWLLGGQRVAALRTDGRTPLGCRADAGKMSRGRTSQRMSHRRSNERSRVEFLSAHSPVECLQIRRGGRSFRASSPRLRHCQSVSTTRRCPWLRGTRHRQARATGSRRSIGHRMSG
jgi:hypothetical protein